LDTNNEWQKYFNYYAPYYLDEIFTRNTEEEISFLKQELGLPSGSAILDIGCGTGRHSLGLSAQGYKMTGVDISEGMLAQAHKSTKSAGLQVNWVHSNILDYKPKQLFDAAICLCEGALCLLGSGDDAYQRDEQLLKIVYNALKPGSLFIINVLNACRLVRLYSDEDVAAGKFNLLTSTEQSALEIETPTGKEVVHTRERVYMPVEFSHMLQRSGFKVLHLWGGTAGSWHREPLKLDEYEFMVVAQKPG